MIQTTQPLRFSIPWPVLLIIGIKLFLHLIANAMGGYGYFRDELYYLACSEHLDFGFVDGWEEQATTLAVAFRSLSPEERKICSVFGWNYGRAGAIDFFGRKLGLPSAISSHNNYWIWGPGDYDGRLVMFLAGDLGGREELFEEVEVLDSHETNYVLPYENNLNIYLCRGLKIPVDELWKDLKNYH